MGIDILEFGIERTKPFFRSCVCLKRAHHVGLAAGGREARRLNLVTFTNKPFLHGLEKPTIIVGDKKSRFDV